MREEVRSSTGCWTSGHRRPATGCSSGQPTSGRVKGISLSGIVDSQQYQPVSVAFFRNHYSNAQILAVLGDPLIDEARSPSSVQALRIGHWLLPLAAPAPLAATGPLPPSFVRAGRSWAGAGAFRFVLTQPTQRVWRLAIWRRHDVVPEVPDLVQALPGEQCLRLAVRRLRHSTRMHEPYQLDRTFAPIQSEPADSESLLSYWAIGGHSSDPASFVGGTG